MIKFVLLVNKQGQTRLSRYAVGARPPPALRAAFEGEVVRKCLTRSDKQVRGGREEEKRVDGKGQEGKGASERERVHRASRALSVSGPFFSSALPAEAR
jgi:hypothetical protein